MRMRYLQGSRTSYPVDTRQCLDSPQVVVSAVLLNEASRYVWFLKGVMKEIIIVIGWERAEGFLLGEEKNGQRSEKEEEERKDEKKNENGCTQLGKRIVC